MHIDSENVYSVFSQNFLFLLNYHQMTVQDFHARFWIKTGKSVPTRTIQRWLHGKELPMPGLFSALSEYFDISDDDWFDPQFISRHSHTPTEEETERILKLNQKYHYSYETKICKHCKQASGLPPVSNR